MINKGRQVEIDIAKGLAIIYMVLVHTTEYFFDGSNSLAESIIEFLGSPPGAPIFMFALGIGIVYSRNNTWQQLAKRGGQMLVLSYVYNFLVYSLPHIILFFTAKDSSRLGTAISELLNVDILQFAALTFLTFAIIKKFNWNMKKIVAYGVVVSLAGELISKYLTLPEEGFGYAIDLFIGVNDTSYFPYCSWIIFPLAGYIFGTALSNCSNKKAFYGKLALIGFPIYGIMMVVAFFLSIDFGQLDNKYQIPYYHMGLYGNLCMLAFGFGYLALCYVASCILPESVKTYFKQLSSNITKMYVIQYVVIIYTYEFIAAEESTLNLPLTLIASLVFFIIVKKLASIKVPQLAIKPRALARESVR